MKSVLILAYYFPPGNFAGSYRAEDWAENLMEFGYRPIVITRHWNENDIDYTAINNKKAIETEHLKSYDLVKVPFRGSLRDRLIAGFGSKWKMLGKILSFFQLIGQNFFLFSSPSSNLFHFANQYLNDHPETEFVIASGKPFILFRYGYLLKQNHPNIKWLADYRDPWNSDSNNKDSLRAWLFKKLEKPLERKWVKTASLITTVSGGVAEGIQSIVNHPQHPVIVKNGFKTYINSESSKKTFSICYIGTLYNEQNIEIFLDGFSLFIKQFRADANVLFLGLRSQTLQSKRVNNRLGSLNKRLFMEPRLPKQEMIKKASECHLLLICGMPLRKGTYTAKFMDYLSLRKPIMVCPGDDGVLDEAIQKAKIGFVLNNEEEVCSILNSLYQNWKNQGHLNYSPVEKVVETYRTSHQVKNLAKSLDRLSKY